MRVLRTVQELSEHINGLSDGGVAVVPTMGALHLGHLSLVEVAKANAANIIATIFLNPRQFSPNEDLSRYPRQEENDIEMLDSVGCQAVFVPDVAEMYPPGFSTVVSIKGLSEVLCGSSRIGHFDGVATVVAKLLLLTSADYAVFGEKDYQQLLIIKRLAQDLNLKPEIIGAPIVREPDGLALSSRNTYLNEEQRKIAPLLYSVLSAARSSIKSGTATQDALSDAKTTLLQGGFENVEYLELRDNDTLKSAEYPDNARLFAAAMLGQTRLIDNLAI